MSKVIHALAQSQQILVYAGKGSSELSSKALVEQLGKLLDPALTIKAVSGRFLKTEDWENNTLALVFGAGECTKWDQALGDKGKEKIRNYVLKGGSYLGFCAASYFASAKSTFALYGQPPIEKERSLAFFSGKAIGPLVATNDYHSPASALAMEVNFIFKGKLQTGLMYYQGGCSFDIENDTNETRILGRNKEGKAVVIECSAGKGKAVLFSPHIEFSWTANLVRVSHQIFSDLALKLNAYEEFRFKVWQEIGSRLALPLKTSLL